MRPSMLPSRPPPGARPPPPRPPTQGGRPKGMSSGDGLRRGGSWGGSEERAPSAEDTPRPSLVSAPLASSAASPAGKHSRCCPSACSDAALHAC